MTRTLHVVTQRAWMARDLADALEPAGWQVAAHHGLSALPPEVGHDPNHVLWAPGAFAAREIFSGNPLRLSTPGPEWLPRLSDPWNSDVVSSGRQVEIVSASDAYNHPREGFWKLAEAKYDRFPSEWRTAGTLVDDIRSARLPAASRLHFTDTRLRIIREYRAVVCRGEVTAVSCYLDNKGRDRSDPEFKEPAPVVQKTAERLLRIDAEQIEAHFPAGPAYTLDIASTADGCSVVLETNPVWSSAWYGCDLVAFADAVAAAQGESVPDGFVWAPDALLIDRARKAGPLPVDHEPGTGAMTMEGR